MSSPYPDSATVQVLTADGQPLTVEIGLIDFMYMTYVKQAISFGVQLGASAIMLLMVLVLTQAGKRRAPIFICNCLALVFNIVRGVMYCVFLTGPFRRAYPNLSGDYDVVPEWARNVSVSSDVFTLLTVITIEISLILQVKAICTDITMPMWFRRSSVILVSVAALATCAVRMALTISNGIANKQAKFFPFVRQLAKANNITFSITICLACLFLVYKLKMAISNQRTFQLSNRMGPMQVIFIMMCQTLVIPAILSILQHFPKIYDSVLASVTTFVCISLPLSSLWATSVTTQRLKEMEKNRFEYSDRFVTGFPDSPNSLTSPTSPLEKDSRHGSTSEKSGGILASIFNGNIPKPSPPVLRPVIEPCPNDLEAGETGQGGKAV